MKKSRKNDPAFRTTFVFLVSTAFVLLVWQCTRHPSGPSRIDWPAGAAAKP